METKILTYVLYASLSLSAFYAIYWLLLRKSTHFAFNRVYLIIALCLSMALPFINIPQLAISLAPGKNPELVNYEFQYQNVPQALPQHYFETVPDDISQTASNGFEFTTILFWLYLAGLTVMLTRLTIMLAGVWKLYRSARFDIISGKRVAISDQLKIPSSFLNVLFIPESKVNSSDIDKVIAHEQVHIRQCHTLDILLAELITIIQWFNPFVWLLKRSLRNVHEYLADNDAVNRGTDVRAYQMALLKYSVGGKKLSLTHTFTASEIKKRIRMMNKPRSGKLTCWKTLAIIPAALLLLSAWANPQPNNQDDKTRTIRGTVYSQGDGFPQHDGKTPISGVDIMVKGSIINAVSGEDGSFELMMPADTSMLVFLSKENGFMTVPILPNDSIVDVALSRYQASMYRKNTGLRWLSRYTTARQSGPELSQSLQQTDSLQPLYVVDGEVKGTSRQIINDLRPEEIESIEVLKGQQAIDRYGNEAGNGAIVITTKENADGQSTGWDTLSRARPNRPVYVQAPGRQVPVYVIDGKVYKGEPYYLEPDEIESMYVIHSPEAAKAYGETGRAVVRITKKKGASKDSGRNKPTNMDDPDPSRQPLYIVDGKQVKSIEDLNPEDIDKLNVMRAEQARTTYGDAARYGAIVITTKQSANK